MVSGGPASAEAMEGVEDVVFEVVVLVVAKVVVVLVEQEAKGIVNKRCVPSTM
jgi:hypothetical protein